MADQVKYGIEAGDQALTTGERWPRIRPKDGDRVRFHFLTDGSDPWLVATRFHSVVDGDYRSNILCLHAFTNGAESCAQCDIDPTNRRNMFACWVWVEYILHPHDNPDEKGDSWEQKQLKLPDNKTRAVFMESINQPSLLWLPAGRQKVWWSQFTNAWMVSGNLRKHLYELYRTGSGRDDTNYVLTAIKEEPLAEDFLEKDEVKDLPAIEIVFRDTLRFTPSVDVLGTDSLDGTEPEALPAAAGPTAVAEDDLI